MPIIGSGGETAMSYIQSTIGDQGPVFSKYYKTPNGATPVAYTAVPTSGTLAYSQFRGAVTTTPEQPQTSAGNACYGGKNTAIYSASASSIAIGQAIIGAPGTSVSGGVTSKQQTDYFGQTPPQGYSPVGYYQPFTIPQYTEIRFELSGAGGTSGSSIWDPSAIAAGACVANGQQGIFGQHTFLMPPNGAVTGNQIFRAGDGNPYGGAVNVYGDPTTNGTEIVYAGGGRGGGGAQWQGGCDGRSGGTASATPAAAIGGGINGAHADARDQIIPAGGAAGGISTGYLNRAGTGGAPGGAGTLVKKFFNRNGPGAPIPGDTWYIWIGYNNAFADNGAWGRGNPGWCYIYWT